MKALLDSSAYSAFLRGHPGVKEAVAEAVAVYLNAIVLGELRAGFLRGSQRRRNEALLSRFCESPRVVSVAVDAETSERYAVILDALRRAGTPIGTNDLWIAATAMQHGLTLLTTDTDFLQVAQIVTRCFEP
jgi:predicted nucleic acid-binding protein